MNQKKRVLSVILLFVFTFIYYNCYANNIIVTNVSLTGQNTPGQYVMVKFDISWENSWRTSSALNNWDAAWIFVKYREIGANEWKHAWLNNTGHLNPSGSIITTGLVKPDTVFNPTTNPGVGAFIYRDADGTGTFSKTGVQIRWNYGANGLTDNSIVDIRVFAIEQVFVPQGGFFVGSGAPEKGAFYKFPSTTSPFQISDESEITVGTATDNLYYESGFTMGDALGPIPVAFPKGYNAFYCMKYEITQQEYVDFLNCLTSSQDTARYSFASAGNRYGVTYSSGGYSTSYPYVACNFINWNDVAAFLDWSGLRPMTELEFEKACRGTLPPVPNEYAWGNTDLAAGPYTLENIGTSMESVLSAYSPTSGNAAIQQTIAANINGPVRVGIFAGHSLNWNRITSGATYYGIMEMSGNLEERCVTVGNPTGRAFNGLHGNGLLSTTGYANVTNWPNSAALGAGFRGGIYRGTTVRARVSYRYYAGMRHPDRLDYIGGRGVRSVF
ncbi:MAG: SUMF1/EgtB/PvdO family nonheme iron enzyme [Candidatus Kapaibacterium sp.]